MSAKNVKTLRAAHVGWNKRDFAGLVSNAVKGLAYTDHGRNTLSGGMQRTTRMVLWCTLPR